MDTLGIYLHIPFCDGKCNYCDFFSFKAHDAELDSYTDIMLNQIKNHSKTYGNRPVDTVYFGGGTPSILGTERIVKILNRLHKAFKITEDCEITLEANPASGGSLDFAQLKHYGVNRVSLGMQSSNDRELMLLGRRHRKKDVISTVERIRSGGIDNISLDVMIGIPQQNEESLLKSLELCCSLDVPHISTYLLTIEENTYFGKHRDDFSFADDDKQAHLYMLTGEFLKGKGYEHYEISNFCKSSKQSKHNMRYWQLKDYLGLGPSAHSLINGRRSYYPKSIEAFKDDDSIYDGIGNTAEEYIMLMLRTKNGISLTEYKDCFGEPPSNSFYQKAEFYKKHGYMEIDGNCVRLTEKGFLMSNTIIADLI